MGDPRPLTPRERIQLTCRSGVAAAAGLGIGFIAPWLRPHWTPLAEWLAVGALLALMAWCGLRNLCLLSRAGLL